MREPPRTRPTYPTFPYIHATYTNHEKETKSKIIRRKSTPEDYAYQYLWLLVGNDPLRDYDVIDKRDERDKFLIKNNNSGKIFEIIIKERK